MDGKTNKNNHNKQTNHENNQNDDLSMFRRSNDFRTRKRKKFKDKVDDEQSFSSSFDDNDKERNMKIIILISMNIMAKINLMRNLSTPLKNWNSHIQMIIMKLNVT